MLAQEVGDVVGEDRAVGDDRERDGAPLVARMTFDEIDDLRQQIEFEERFAAKEADVDLFSARRRGEDGLDDPFGNLDRHPAGAFVDVAIGAPEIALMRETERVFPGHRRSFAAC